MWDNQHKEVDTQQRRVTMLILSRRTGESLMVDDDVVVTVLGVKGNQVRLGVNAPRDKAVHREEVFKKISSGRTGRFRPPKRRGIDARFHR
jgi:carbon storage regulator